MNRDLFLAILAMDVYNRGSGAGINNLALSTEEAPQFLGNARLISNNNKVGWANANFYALSQTVT
jgi:hypothetical protein